MRDLCFAWDLSLKRRNTWEQEENKQGQKDSSTSGIIVDRYLVSCSCNTVSPCPVLKSSCSSTQEDLSLLWVKTRFGKFRAVAKVSVPGMWMTVLWPLIWLLAVLRARRNSLS